MLSGPRRQRGAVLAETVVVMPVLALLGLGVMQWAFIYEAKSALNHATFMATRAGITSQADPAAMRLELARSLAPLYSPERNPGGLLRARARAAADIALNARLRILNPTREAFDDFGLDSKGDGVREIPFERLHVADTRAGSASGVNIQDANLLKLEVVYGYELKVPFAGPVIATLAAWFNQEPYARTLLARGRLPILATATVRMQSAARENDLVADRADVRDAYRSDPTVVADASRPGHRAWESGPTGSGTDGASGFIPVVDGSGGAEGGGGGEGGADGSFDEGDTGGGTGLGSPDSCDENDAPAATDAPGQGRAVGNPVDVVTGNKYQAETDLSPLPGPLGLRFVRHYNSRLEQAGALGYGWRHSYMAALERIDGEIIRLRQSDGRLLVFRREPGGLNYRATAAADGAIEPLPHGYDWVWNNGRRLLFDREGRLTDIRQADGHGVRLAHDAEGRLASVTDPRGRRLTFLYGDGGRLAGVIDPGGQRVLYRYDRHGNLETVAYPDGTVRTYHYEDSRDPHNLTGLTDERGVRFATWAYDEHDRAVLSTHAEGVGRVTLEYRAGQTLVTDAAGSTSRYDTALRGGIPLVTRIIGPGCSTCGQGDVAYRYDERLRLTQVTGKGGRAQTFAYDGQDRLIRAATLLNSEILDWTAFEYGGGARRPATVVRPSVKPGAEYRTTITYNDDGQPLSVTETGFAPAAGEYVHIRRTLRIEYREGLPAAVDGPREEVPDRVGFHYDGAGRLVAVESPLGVVVTVRAFDAYGRPVRVAVAGQPERRLTYDARGRLSSVYDGARQRVYAYDPAGRLQELGEQRGAGYQGLVRWGYDAAGRNTWIAETGGVLRRFAFDAAGRLREATRLSGRVLERERYGYDPEGRLSRVTDASGAVRRLAHDDLGRLVGLTDPLGRTTRYGYDRRGRLARVVEAANTPYAALVAYDYDPAGRLASVTAPNGAPTRYEYDDFGRTVAIASPDSGRTVLGYDPADNLVARTDGQGNRESWRYDAAGRVVAATVVAAGEAEAAVTTAYRWCGARLCAVEHPNQRERYEYDARRRLVRKTVALTLASGREVEYTTRYRWDPERGALRARTLPDGTELRYVADGLGQIVALERRADPSASPRALVSGLERDLVGLRSLRYGNGVEGRYERSAQGRLARLLYRHPGPREPNLRPAAHHEPGRTGGEGNRLEWRRAGLAGPVPGDDAPGALGLPPAAGALAETRYLWDLGGNLLHAERLPSDRAGYSRWDYAYDPRDRLVGARRERQAADAAFWRYFHDGNGNRLLAQEGGGTADVPGPTVRLRYAPASNQPVVLAGEARSDTPIAHNRAGRRVAQAGRRYAWDGKGRLTTVREGGRTRATYRYNHRGERISKTVWQDGAPVTTHFLYENRRLVAELDGEGRILRQYLYVADRPLATVDTPWGKDLNGGAPATGFDLNGTLHTVFDRLTAREERITYLHLDHLGAPEAATDTDGNVVWRAEYSPYGRARTESPGGAYQLNLRFPGQYEDRETGLHYNDHRYYDPDQGRYLSPDPLGLRGGINPYGYVAGNPLRYVDPLGLVLFAFDGTWNDHDKVLTNVELFRRHYIDDDEQKFYVKGVGTGIFLDPYIGGALGIGVLEQVETHLRNLDRYLEGGAPGSDHGNYIMVDVIGFSRGAAAARTFVNQVLSRRDDGYYIQNHGYCVVVRFLGLFDTVAMTIEDIDLRIRPEVMYTAQAVALNEHRRLFSLQSIEFDPSFPGAGAPMVDGVSPGVVIERGFIGAHSDIGGGYCGKDIVHCPGGDLSDVALNWMVMQAERAGVVMKELPQALKTVSNPILHDESSRKRMQDNSGGIDYVLPEDRRVLYPNDPDARDRPRIYQDTMELFGLTTKETARYITPRVNSGANGFSYGQVGNVRIGGADGYGAWLEENYGFTVKVQ